MALIKPEVFAAMAIHSAMKLYLKAGMQVNRAYTPANMRDAATRYTGRVYKRTELPRAMIELGEWIDMNK